MPVALLMSINPNSSYPVGSLVSDRSVFVAFGKSESKRRWIQMGLEPNEWEPKFIKLIISDLSLGAEDYQMLKPNFETGRPIRFLSLPESDLDIKYPQWRDNYEFTDSWANLYPYIKEVE